MGFFFYLTGVLLEGHESQLIGHSSLVSFAAFVCCLLGLGSTVKLFHSSDICVRLVRFSTKVRR